MAKESYKSIYKKHCYINGDCFFEIHHIDHNHNNNNIENLVLLPKKLHREYHRLFRLCSTRWEKLISKRVCCDYSIDGLMFEKLSFFKRMIAECILIRDRIKDKAQSGEENVFAELYQEYITDLDITLHINKKYK